PQAPLAEPAPAPADESTAQPVVSFKIPLTSLKDAEKLERRSELKDVVDASRRYPMSQIYLGGYVTEDDTRKRHGDAYDLGDEIVINTARTLTQQGVDPNRISGKGMGINPTIGRAVVASFDLAPRSTITGMNPREVAEYNASQMVPERLPPENTAFKEIAGIVAYRVGPGDVLKITRYHASTGLRETAVAVGPLGTISYDLIDHLPVQDLTTLEIESVVKTKLRRYYRNPRLTVSVVKSGSRAVTVITPAGTRRIPLTGRTSIFDLLGVLGNTTGRGAAGVADLKAIRVTRGTKEFRVNAFEIVQNHDWKENLVLDDGDVVYVPTFTESGNFITVLGAVVRPGIYPVPGTVTALAAMFQAGGALREAHVPHARILRGSLDRLEIIPADIDLVQQGNVRANKDLKSGDILFVPNTRIHDWNLFINDVRPTLEIATLPFRYLFLGLSLDDRL
ncbi:MAG: polysaccharide biosynthesis/export family protein, partial [Candidatus Binatia bacterium]